MTNKLTIAGVILALVLGVAGLFIGDKTYPVIERTVGAFAGPDIFQRLFLREGVTAGGNILATTTGTTLSTFTLSANELGQKTSVVKINPSVDLALKLGATTTGALVPNIGDTAIVYLKNASTTVASSITLSAADASMDLNPSEVTGGDLVLSGLNWMRLDIIRNAFTGTNHVTVLVSEWVPD